MVITKTIEECNRQWELIESGQIAYNDPERAGQCHKPLLTQSGRLFAILHQELSSLDLVLKVYYHLISGEKIWSEANRLVKERIAAAKILAISHIKVACGGLLIDSPTAAGGNTNTGPVARRFFSSDNREAICSIIDEAEDRYKYGLLLEQINICLAISESVDPSKILDVEKFKEHCLKTMLHICLHFPWVQISPTVHQMLAHN